MLIFYFLIEKTHVPNIVFMLLDSRQRLLTVYAFWRPFQHVNYVLEHVTNDCFHLHKTRLCLGLLNWEVPSLSLSCLSVPYIICISLCQLFAWGLTTVPSCKIFHHYHWHSILLQMCWQLNRSVLSLEHTKKFKGIQYHILSFYSSLQTPFILNCVSKERYTFPVLHLDVQNRFW